MTSTLVTNIAELVTNDPGLGDGTPLGVVADAAMVVEGDSVVWVGRSAGAPSADEVIDVEGRCVIPGFVDSHAHLIFDGDRSAEFVARMAREASGSSGGEGESGGGAASGSVVGGAASGSSGGEADADGESGDYTPRGIHSTVSATRAASDGQLRTNAARLVDEMSRQGITTLEIKSGYGLTVDDEVRALRIASEFTTETTYLGAHVVPRGTDPSAYVALVTGPMLEACAPHARWIDVFCDVGAFDGDQAREIVGAGVAAGLMPRLHANQLGYGPGVQVAVEVGAASADHCTFLTDDDVAALAGSSTVATLLPGAEFSTRAPYPDARRLLGAGVIVALATDCNPGSSYTTSMPFCIAVAVRDMHMSVAEAVWAATAGGARALRRDDVGVLAPGKRADFAVLDAPTHTHLAYRPGVPLVTRTSGPPAPRLSP